MTPPGRYNKSESRVAICVILVQDLILVFLAASGLVNSFLECKGKTILKAK